MFFILLPIEIWKSKNKIEQILDVWKIWENANRIFMKCHHYWRPLKSLYFRIVAKFSGVSASQQPLRLSHDVSFHFHSTFFVILFFATISFHGSRFWARVWNVKLIYEISWCVGESANSNLDIAIQNIAAEKCHIEISTKTEILGPLPPSVVWLYRFFADACLEFQLKSSRRRGEQVEFAYTIQKMWYCEREEEITEINCRIACSSARKSSLSSYPYKIETWHQRKVLCAQLEEAAASKKQFFNFHQVYCVFSLKEIGRGERRLSGNLTLWKSIFCAMSCHSLYHPSFHLNILPPLARSSKWMKN